MARHALLIGIQEYPHLVERDLDGPRNDVIELAQLLVRRFDFPVEQVHAYFKGTISRQKVVDAFEELGERVGTGDVVAVYYSGHGSRSMRDDRLVESLVPSDSGRPAPDGDGSPNRDIFDLEVRGWIERLRRKTPHLTLIFDCCHAGSVTRDPFVDGERSVPADHRPTATRSLDRSLATVPTAAGDGPSSLFQGLEFGSTGALVLSACRAEEKAKEYKVPTTDGGAFSHGAFTFFLSRALQRLEADATWRSVFESSAPRVTSIFPSQHPQIEGAWDALPFGTEVVRARPYVRVESADGDRVTLAGGAAHGVSEGDEWALHAASVADPDSAEELGRLIVEAVAPGASVARLRGDGRAEPGQRAFLVRAGAPSTTWRILLPDDVDAQLRRRIEGSPLLEIADGIRAADAAVRLLAPRWTVDERTLCPRLGPLDAPTWTVIGKDGRSLVAPRPDGPDAVAALVDALERLARYRGLLSIYGPEGASSLHGKVDLRVQRWSDSDSSRPGSSRPGSSGGFVDAEPAPGDGLPRFSWDDPLELVIENRHDAPVWVSLLHFGCDFSIDLLLPNPKLTPEHGGYRLGAGESLRLAADYYSRFLRLDRGLTLRRPDGFPWEADAELGPDPGSIHLRLMVTEERADFRFVCAERTRDPGLQAHPLLELSRLHACGTGRRDAVGIDPAGAWDVVHRSLLVTDGDPS